MGVKVTTINIIGGREMLREDRSGDKSGVDRQQLVLSFPVEHEHCSDKVLGSGEIMIRDH